MRTLKDIGDEVTNLCGGIRKKYDLWGDFSSNPEAEKEFKDGLKKIKASLTPEEIEGIRKENKC